MAAKLVFFGNERLATGVTTTAPTLQALVAAGYEISAVVIAQNEAGKSRKGRPLEIIQLAEQHGIPVLAPARLSEIRDQLADMQADAAVLVAYGKLVPQNIIDLFPKGIINIHPSLLPKHRGSIPLESVILHGETKTGVSLMQLVREMDAGPIYAQQIISLTGDETKQELADTLLELGGKLLIETLPLILDDSIEPKPQDAATATYDARIQKEHSELDFNHSAAQLVRQIRALAGWPRSRAMIGTTEVIITKAHTEAIDGVPGTLWLDNKQFGIHCSTDTLVIDSLIPAGKKEMPASAFLAGYRPA